LIRFASFRKEDEQSVAGDIGVPGTLDSAEVPID